MNKLEFRKLIREEVRKVINEGIKLAEAKDELSQQKTLLKKGTKFQNNSNGKILKIAKDFEVTLPLTKEDGRKMILIYSPEFKSGDNPSGIERTMVKFLFTGGFTQLNN